MQQQKVLKQQVQLESDMGAEKIPLPQSSFFKMGREEEEEEEDDKEGKRFKKRKLGEAGWNES